jgi:ADP-ribosylglycohydrolase
MFGMLSGSAADRLARAQLSLEGLSLGDGFGERFFTSPAVVEQLITSRALPAPPWITTDDTEMATAIVDVLEARGRIDRDLLARAFAHRYSREPGRGYGGGAHQILSAICAGTMWHQAAFEAFDGQGSFGNGGAMRSAPVGAYFADDPESLVGEAEASAEVTHAHPEGKAGAIAVALAAAWACRHQDGVVDSDLLTWVIGRAPESEVRDGIVRARALPFERSPRLAAGTLGSGQRVAATDTVPFALWCAARHADSFEEAMWNTVTGLGDRDTTCAIVGGIVALSSGRAGLPAEWLNLREPIRHDRVEDTRR